MSVPALLADARGYTSGLVSQASSAMNSAISMVAAIGYTIPAAVSYGTPALPPSSLSLTMPLLDSVTLDMPAEPSAALVFQDIGVFDAGAAPTFAVDIPLLVMPTAPSQVAAFLAVAPGIKTDIAFPEPPSGLMNPMIEAPVLPVRTEPTAPAISLPTFGAITPVDNTVAPTDFQPRFEGAYAGVAPSMVAMMNGYVDAHIDKYNPRYKEQMGRIEAQLATYHNGGTGLNAAAENAIYERARSKNDAEARRTRAGAFNDAADRGFTLPTGAMMSAMQQARQAGADNNARAASEIVVMQAEMEQKNLQFAVTTSASLRATMLNSALSYHQNLVTINGQALDYAKSVLSAIVETYNTAVKAFTVKLEAYKAEAFAYEVRLKSAMAGIELYRVQIASLEALANVDRSKVDIYRARIESLTSLSNVYRSQIEAVAGRASLEKLKLELFQSQVQSYSAQVQGKASEWQGYTAAIEGQTAKVKIFGTQVEAYNAQVQGYKATLEAKTEVVRAAAITNQGRATQYSAMLSGYTAVVQARGEKARTQIENQRQLVVAFQAQTQAAVANAQVQAEYYRSTSSVAIEGARLKLSAQVQTAESTRSFGQSMAQLGTANATIFGNLAGAALSGMNTLSAETLASS